MYECVTEIPRYLFITRIFLFSFQKIGNSPVVLDHGDDERTGDEYAQDRPVLGLAVFSLLGRLVCALEFV
jgi:hypothetical protein